MVTTSTWPSFSTRASGIVSSSTQPHRSRPGGRSVGSMTAPMLIDADSHVTEPADVWTSRVPARYVDEVPRVVRNDDGKDVWLLGGVAICTVGATSTAGFPGAPAARPRVYEELHPGSYDAGARLRYMDQ